MIKIICVGKLKEKYLIDLTSDYYNRIKKYHKISIVELKDSNIERESSLILKNIKPNEYIISLDIKGKKINTLELKENIRKIFNNHSIITFIIGGSLGISKEVIKKSNEVISFSNFTFPHGLFRGILLEQIYRVFKILNNETYHK